MRILAGASSSLGTTYSALGRHADALVLFQKALNILRCTLPADHPEICEGTERTFDIFLKSDYSFQTTS
jgi:hypothetical protein